MRAEKNALAIMWNGMNRVFAADRQKQNVFMKYTFGCLLIFLLSANVFAGNENSASADRTLRSSGRVNPSTLGMEIDIPLGSYPGRGINVPINLSYSSKLWRMQYSGEQPVSGGNNSPCYPNYFVKYSEDSASGWTSSLAVPYIEYTGMNNFYNADGTAVSTYDDDCPSSGPAPGIYPHHYIRRLIIHLPSGETHELRPDDTVISFASSGSNDPSGPYQSYNWNTTYYAVDGSNIKYIQDSTANKYQLQMPDGSFYDFAATPHSSIRKAAKFTDRNGNYTTYYAPGSVDSDNVTHPNGYWKDTLGRNISIPLAPQAPAAPTTAQNPQIYKMPGMTGTYKLQWKHLNGGTQAESALTDIYAADHQLKPESDVYLCYNGGFPAGCVYPAGVALFSGGGNSTGPRITGSPAPFNPVVLTEIELPTGQKYEFKYDIYGRIEKIIYPTGGEETFQYSVVPTLSMLEYGDLTGNTNFGVTNRKVYPTAGQTAHYQWTYSANYVSSQGYQVTINNPDGTRSERLLRRGNDAGTFTGFGYDNGLAGMAYEERAFSSANQLVSKKLTTWTASQLQTSGGAIVSTTHWHPRVMQEESVIYDNLGSGVSATTQYGYEDEANLNQRAAPVLMKKSSQYPFVTAGSPLPANPVRSSETTFLINDQHYSGTASIYRNQNMIGLATASIVKNGAGQIVSRSEMVYDEYSYSPNVGRGNPTSARVWDSTKDLDYNNPNAYIQTRARFDVYGNQYESIDAKGNATTTTYDSTYHAFPITVTSAVPSDGTYGSDTAFQTSATFNPTTGLPLAMTDANGLETRIEYDAATLRPLNTKTFYQNAQVGGTAETIYHDEPNNYWIKSRAQIDTGVWAESITYFDGLGRAYKSEQVDSQGNIFVEKEFDAEGRVKRVTNPFRANEAKQWTTNVYDEASRIRELDLPDGAKVLTDYGVSTATGLIGVTKTITDQAGKKRKGISDALGRMIRVTEDPTGQNLNTDYVFDTLGNLRKTIQGEQNRFFTYDSLGRLLYAKQPEQDANTAFVAADSITGNSQWSVKYEYDDNGNITKTIDARGIYVAGTYDNFNRLKLRDYSDSTPDVSFYYDGRGLGAVPAFSKGKTTRISSSVTETRYTSFDNLGRLLTHQQITDGQTYNTGYAYNLSGALIEETYPSGRVVRNVLNADGELSAVQSKKNAEQGFFTYADSFSYNSAGAMTKMQLGNGHWETYQYNSRQQIMQIGLGTTDAQTDLLKLEYDYGNSTQNNGNLRSQKISFSGLSQPFVQTYNYDSLNRLQDAKEMVGTTQTWKQTFLYDRYGNRRFDTANNNTTTLGGCAAAACNPQINTSNNRFSTGQGYTYDAGGNLTIDAGGRQFLYDAENHQKEVKDQYGATLGSYFYDGEGKRVKKKSSTETTIFVYNASAQLVAEYSIALSPTQQVSYLTADHLSSPRVITDASGAVKSRKDFTAFGEQTATAQRTENLGYQPPSVRQGYTGYEKDEESGLEFAQARFYNSIHGRYTSIDPLTASADTKNPQTFNRYSYVLNSPYKFVDPLGLISSSTGACGTWCSGGSYSGGTNFDDVKATMSTLRWRQIKADPPAPPPAPQEDDPPIVVSPGTKEILDNLAVEVAGILNARDEEISNLIDDDSQRLEVSKALINENSKKMNDLSSTSLGIGKDGVAVSITIPSIIPYETLGKAAEIFLLENAEAAKIAREADRKIVTAKRNAFAKMEVRQENFDNEAIAKGRESSTVVAARWSTRKEINRKLINGAEIRGRETYSRGADLFPSK
jgi:RHS repeat-associated protein